MNEDALKLAALWRAEQERDGVVAARQALLDAGRGARAALTESEEAVAALEAQAVVLRALERVLEARRAVLNRQKASAARALDGIVATDFMAAQRQVEQTVELLAALEEEHLALLDQQEAKAGQLEGLRSVVVLRRRLLLEAQRAWDEQRGPLEARLAEATRIRDAHREDVPRDLLARYDDLRRRNMTVFTPVRAGACATCNVTLTTNNLLEHKRGVGAHQCNGCRRFLGEVT